MTPLVIALIWSGVCLAAAAACVIIWSGRRRVLEKVRESDRQRLDALGTRHATLKESVSRAERDEQRSLQIYGVAKSLAEALSWKDMAPRLSQGIQKIFDAHEFLLYALDESGRWTQLQRRGNWAKEPPFADLSAAQGGAYYPPQIQELVPVYSIPILTEVGGKPRKIGMVFLKSDKPFAFDIKDTAEDFGAQLGVALAKATLFNRMEMHSLHDGLTGALRRQPFMDRITEELKKAAVFHTSFSILMVDIDHFKAVNDTHGHAAGDAVLARTGQLLHESFYETDVVGRYGGEEFVVLLPRADAAGVLRKAEALRHRFEAEVIRSGFESLRITVSVGLAHYPQNGRTAEELIASADRALYRAKETGRNRVVAA
jgi:diguanylate cyclase (GGDEF)-like protein